MTDELIIRMGLDTSSVKSSLGRIPQMLKGLKALGIGALIFNFDSILDGLRDGVTRVATSLRGALIATGAFLNNSGASLSERLQIATNTLNDYTNAAAQEQRRIEQMRKANQDRWAKEKEELLERERLEKRIGDLIKQNETIRQRRVQGAKNLDENRAGLATLKRAKDALLQLGEREKAANIDKHILDLEDRIADQMERQRNLLKEQIAAKKQLADAHSSRADLGKLSLSELANSTAPKLQADRERAAKAQRLADQAESARLRGDSQEALRLLGQRDRVIQTGDRSKMNLADLRNLQSAEAFEKRGDRRMAEFFRSRVSSEFSGINSIKDSEKQTPLEQANKNIADSAESLKTIENEIKRLSKI